MQCDNRFYFHMANGRDIEAKREAGVERIRFQLLSASAFPILGSRVFRSSVMAVVMNCNGVGHRNRLLPKNLVRPEILQYFFNDIACYFFTKSIVAVEIAVSVYVAT